eukprot:1757701-Rhodomonas_salina.3
MLAFAQWLRGPFGDTEFTHTPTELRFNDVRRFFCDHPRSGTSDPTARPHALDVHAQVWDPLHRARPGLQLGQHFAFRALSGPELEASKH